MTIAIRRLLRLPRSPKMGVGSGADTGAGSAAGTGPAAGPGAALIAYRETSKSVSTSVNFMMKTLMRFVTFLKHPLFK